MYGQTRSVPMAAPNLSISPEKVCFFINLAHEFDVKDVVSDPDSGSNSADDAMLDVLEDHADDPTEQELRTYIDGLTEDEQIDLVALMWRRPGDGTVNHRGGTRGEGGRPGKKR